ncbi:MAG TPA: BatD family protein [Vicinamibacteria bacterium]|nr:BatD family protein [Vicinamibacteria bacterium]
MLLALAILLAQQVTVGATVNAERIGVEDMLQLTVSISGGEPSAEPVLPELPQFRVAGRSTSSQIQIVNGQMSSTRSYTYQLLPQKEGKFVIGAVGVQVSGEKYETDPIEVEVVAGSLGSGRSRGRSLDPFDSISPFGRLSESPQVDEADVFLRTEVSKRSAFLGEQVVVTYRLFSRYIPLGPELDDDPPLEGFWVEDVDPKADSDAERRTIDGKPYVVFPVKRRVVFPTTTGTLTIPPITLSMAFRLTSNDPFDAFFSRASAPVTVRSSPVTIDVAPLPDAGRTRDFNGAVGEYELRAKLNKDTVPAGQPVTLTVSVEGKGNLRSMEAPVLPELSGFRAFAPKTDVQTRAGATGLAGGKTWEYVLVPESGGVKELGPWSFQYFDPEQKKYVTASVGPLRLLVEGGSIGAGADAISSGSPRGEVTVLRQDIRYLKDPPDRLGASDRPFHQSAYFYWTLALPVMWNLAFVAYLRQREKRRLHSDVFRSRAAHRTARKRLKKAAGLADVASRDFYEEIATALYRYVGDKLSLSPSGLTSSSIDELLEARNVPEDTRRELAAVLEKCEEARFSPGKRTREEMSAIRERAEDLLVSLVRQLG